MLKGLFRISQGQHVPSPSSSFPLILDSVTELPARAPGPVLLTGSHGGVYAAQFALARGIRAALFHDAGIGRDNAGIACLEIFGALGLPCAAVDAWSARIGNAGDMMERGRVSHANREAGALGVEAGMGVVEALAAFQENRAAPGAGELLEGITPGEETRAALDIKGARRPVWLLDSASLISPRDAGAVVVTGSHGGLPGNDPARAARAHLFCALFNDAGIGRDEAGVRRLGALEERGISGAAVAAQSACIGEAASTLETGILSRVNALGVRLGGAEGMTAREFVERAARHDTGRG